MPKLSQAPKLDEETLEKLAGNCVAFLMTRNDRKVAVKKADMIKAFLPNHSKSYDVVLERALEKIKIFGLKIVKVDHPVKGVLLVNPCRDMFPYSKRTPEEKAASVLCLLVLSFIFMRNNCVRDDVLWDYLRKLGLVKEDNSHFVHSYFGDVRKTVSKTFVRQMYLDCCKVPNGDPPYYEYSFGKRALVETSKRSLLEFVCKMYGSDTLELFRSHLEIVIKEEEEQGLDGEETAPSTGETLPLRSSASQPGLSSLSQPGPSRASQPGLSSLSQPGPSSQMHPLSQSVKHTDTDRSRKRRKN